MSCVQQLSLPPTNSDLCNTARTLVKAAAWLWFCAQQTATPHQQHHTTDRNTTKTFNFSCVLAIRQEVSMQGNKTL